MTLDYTCILISNKPKYIEKIANSILPAKLNYFDGTGYPSFSKLVNSAIFSCTTETVIIMSDKVIPTINDIEKTLNLLSQGFGFVGLYRFAFFGVQKELFRKIGVMDERYITGEYEDDDFYIRLKEADIAMYLSEEVAYQKRPSSWNKTLAKAHFINKWARELSNNKISRYMSEISHLEYNLTPGNPDKKYLPWSATICNSTKANQYTQFLK